MRIMLSVSLGIVTLSGLAACGESDEAFRARYRTAAIESCTAGGRASNPAGIDASRFCPCMVDRYMQATSSDQLKAERNQATPPPAARAAIEQCAREIMGGGGQATPAADANRQADAPADDSEENEQ